MFAGEHFTFNFEFITRQDSKSAWRHLWGSCHKIIEVFLHSCTCYTRWTRLGLEMYMYYIIPVSKNTRYKQSSVTVDNSEKNYCRRLTFWQTSNRVKRIVFIVENAISRACWKRLVSLAMMVLAGRLIKFVSSQCSVLGSFNLSILVKLNRSVWSLPLVRTK